MSQPGSPTTSSPARLRPQSRYSIEDGTTGQVSILHRADGLPDFETLLASGSRVRMSSGEKELGVGVVNSPDRAAARLAARPQEGGGGESGTNGVMAAKRDIERAMAPGDGDGENEDEKDEEEEHQMLTNGRGEQRVGQEARSASSIAAGDGRSSPLRAGSSSTQFVPPPPPDRASVNEAADRRQTGSTTIIEGNDAPSLEPQSSRLRAGVAGSPNHDRQYPPSSLDHDQTSQPGSGYTQPSYSAYAQKHTASRSPALSSTPRGQLSPASSATSAGLSSTTVASLAAAMERPSARTRASSSISDGTASSSYVHVSNNDASLSQQQQQQQQRNGLGIPFFARVSSARSNGAGSTSLSGGTAHADASNVSPAATTTQQQQQQHQRKGSFSTASSSSATKKGPARTPQGPDESNTGVSAFRKTSGFFRKTFGWSSQEQHQQETLSTNHTTQPSNAGNASRYPQSAPATPTSTRFDKTRFSSSPRQHPVPTIPSAFMQTNNTTNGPTTSSTMTTPPARPRSQAFKVTQSSPLISGGEMPRSGSSNLSEHERLQRELEYWKATELGLAGVLPDSASISSGPAAGPTGKRTSILSGSSAIPLNLPTVGRGASPIVAAHGTVKAQTSATASATVRTPPRPSNPFSSSSAASPPMNRGRSDSNAVIISGSLPSPNMSKTNSPSLSSNGGTFISSGSLPSPDLSRVARAASGMRMGSDASSISTATTTNTITATPTHPAPNISSQAGEDVFGPTSTSDSHEVNGTPVRILQPPATPPILSSSSGKQVRKRSTSSSAELSLNPASLTRVEGPSSANAGLGLGIGDGGDPARALATNASPKQVVPSTTQVTMFVRPESQPSPTTHGGLIGQSNAKTPSLNVSLSNSARTSRSTTASPVVDVGGDLPTGERAKLLADRCWREDESFLKKEKIAEWLGGPGDLNEASLIAYMHNFDFTAMRLDIAFRKLCEKLYLKAETQQVDRILDAFSAKYYLDNPETIFKHRDIIHAATYAMLLLNTDLHVADVINRMSRSDFVYNTMSAIHAQTASSPSMADSGLRTPASLHTPTMEAPEVLADSVDSVQWHGAGNPQIGRKPSMDRWRDTIASAGRPRMSRSGSASAGSSRVALNESLSTLPPSSSANGSEGTSSEATSPVKARPNTIFGDPAAASRVSFMSSSASNMRAWDLEIEAVLKEIYNAVRARPIMQPNEYASLAPPHSASGSGASTPYHSWASISRSPSRRSQVSNLNDRSMMAHKRTSIRGLLGASHESLRAASPSPSLGSGYPGNGMNGTPGSSSISAYPASLGFASNLTQTIIREQQEDDANSVSSDTSATDEELALLGAPWAKEGILERKHYWEASNRRSKDKNWLQVFAVIEKGDLKMFQFGGSALAGGQTGGVGGGNWLSNAHSVGDVSLAHSLCSAMPPPGYNRQRPHVLVLTLPNGGSYFFQAGTADLVNEWVSTCNYWAGRCSKEPLLGGVSNMDYGWNRVLEAHSSPLTTGAGSGAFSSGFDATEDVVSVRSGRSGHSRIGHLGGTFGRQRTSSMAGGSMHNGAVGVGSNADHITLHEWSAPQPPSTRSALSEDAQYESLKRHTAALKKELEGHNDLRTPMMRLYGARSANASKALANWEKKSKYLLSELVKYQTYVEALRHARAERQKRRDEKRVNRLLEEADEQGTSLDDPIYSPKANSARATFADQQDQHQTHKAVSSGGSSGKKKSSDPASTFSTANGSLRARRLSETTNATATTKTTDFYEADETPAAV